MRMLQSSALSAWVVLSVFLIGCDDASPRSEVAPSTNAVAAADAATNVVESGASSTNAAAAVNAVEADRKSTAESRQQKKKMPEPPAVMEFEVYVREGMIDVMFTTVPDMLKIRDHIRIVPEVDFKVSHVYYNARCVRIEGKFEPKTEYTVVLSAGLPMSDGTGLPREYRRTVVFKSQLPTARFTAGRNGRYLPPAGARAVEVATINVKKLDISLARVPVRNVVQLLARDEGKYGYRWSSVDGESTLQLAEKPFEREIVVDAEENREKQVLVPLMLPANWPSADAADASAENGMSVKKPDTLVSAPNGIYLVRVRPANERNDDGTKAYFGWSHRLVAATDIGLSVRRAQKWIYAWTTSLTTGYPESGLKVEVYGANGVLLASDVSDKDGLAACDCGNGADPFAVVVSREDGSDSVFLALSGSMSVDETVGDSSPREFVAPEGCEAFVWTDRGIYRHDEPVMVQAIVRNGEGNAPEPFPLTLRLISPRGDEYAHATGLTDECGRFTVDDFSVPADQRSGRWRVEATIPGQQGEKDDRLLLGVASFQIEEFVPAKIRVALSDLPEGAADMTNLSVTVSAEHLFGGAARDLPAHVSVSFEDAPFKPEGWKGYAFGSSSRRIAPNFQRLDGQQLDADGRTRFEFAPEGELLPAAAVKLTVQGTVLEGGGRPVNTRRSSVLHVYPFYIGCTLEEGVGLSNDGLRRRLALVNPDGTKHAEKVALKVRFERVESNYTCERDDSGSYTWKCTKLNYPLSEETVTTDDDGQAEIVCPANIWGEMLVRVEDPRTKTEYCATYWVSDVEGGADVLAAPMNDPTALTLVADKKLYMPGDVPRITVKAPFAGRAWITLLREGVLSSQVVKLTNVTSVVSLDAVEADWAPNVAVAVTVVQAVGGGKQHRAARARGLLPLPVTTSDRRLEVAVKADVSRDAAGAHVDVSVDALCEAAKGEVATVTVVDEGINLFTDEPVPDPYGWFAATRWACHPLYDVFNRLLPVLSDPLRANGAKTGGGADEGLFGRVSPVSTRRFKPMSKWEKTVDLKDGAGRCRFDLGAFVGEVRVTAVAVNRRGVGAGAVHAKVAPKLVAQPDAPRFAAPGDTCVLTYTLINRSGAAGSAEYAVAVAGTNFVGTATLEKDGSTTLEFPLTLGAVCGEERIVYEAKGFGETCREELLLPVRPAVAWEKTGYTRLLAAGETLEADLPADIAFPELARRLVTVSESPLTQLVQAFTQLAQYPYGCLEQTTSQVLPLIAAGGVLNGLDVERTSIAADARSAVEAGVARVCSMMCGSRFAMWPDVLPDWSERATWVDAYAAEFLATAAKAGYAVSDEALERVAEQCREMANYLDRPLVAATACFDLALLGRPDKAQMLRLYDSREKLPSVARAYLARAFARTGDAARAKELLAAARPDVGVRANAAYLTALIEVDSKDPRLAGFANALLAARNGSCGHWLTTTDNASALIALASYFNLAGKAAGEFSVSLEEDGRKTALASGRRTLVTGAGKVKIVNAGGPVFATVERRVLPDAAKVAALASGVTIEQRVVTMGADLSQLDPNTLRRGDAALIEIALKYPDECDISDTVIDLPLPACFEPAPCADMFREKSAEWELRREVRDDRVVIFTSAYRVKQGERIVFYVPVSTVTTGSFAFPGATVDAMYRPEVNGRAATTRIAIAR